MLTLEPQRPAPVTPVNQPPENSWARCGHSALKIILLPAVLPLVVLGYVLGWHRGAYRTAIARGWDPNAEPLAGSAPPSWASQHLGLIAGGVGGVAIAVAAVWGAAQLLRSVEPAFDLMPDNPTAIIVIRPHAFLTSDFGTKLKEKFPGPFAMVEQMVDTPSAPTSSEVDIITIGLAGYDQSGAAVVVQLRRSVTIADLVPAEMLEGLKPEEFAGHEFYPQGRGSSLCILDGRTVIMAPTDTLKEILDRQGPAEFSEKLQEAIDQTDFSAHLAVASEIDDVEMTQSSFASSLESNPFKGSLRAVAFNVTAGDSLAIQAALICPDEAAAEEAVTKIDELRKQGTDMASQEGAPAELKSASGELENLQVTSAGNVVKVNLGFNSQTLFDLLDASERLTGGGTPAGPATDTPVETSVK